MGTPNVSDALRAMYGAVPSHQVTFVAGHASNRRYFRITLDAPDENGIQSWVVMDFDPHAGSEEASADETVIATPQFVTIAEQLRAAGAPVLAVHHLDMRQGLMVLDDLGDETFEARLLSRPRTTWVECYRRAIDALVELHAAAALLPTDSIVRTRSFDEKLLRWEFDHFIEWGLHALFGERPDEKNTLEYFSTLVSQRVAAQPQGFVHRDYQSRNLMWISPTELSVIDFQDALLGPREYDLVALLCDSYVSLTLEEQLELIAYYAKRKRLDTNEVASHFWWIAVQRKLKDAGRFIFIDRVKHNPSFLPSFPQSLVYVGRALGEIREPLAPLHALLSQRIDGFPNQVPVPPSTE